MRRGDVWRWDGGRLRGGRELRYLVSDSLEFMGRKLLLLEDDLQID